MGGATHALLEALQLLSRGDTEVGEVAVASAAHVVAVGDVDLVEVVRGVLALLRGDDDGAALAAAGLGGHPERRQHGPRDPHVALERGAALALILCGELHLDLARRDGGQEREEEGAQPHDAAARLR